MIWGGSGDDREGRKRTNIQKRDAKFPYLSPHSLLVVVHPKLTPSRQPIN